MKISQENTKYTICVDEASNRRREIKETYELKKQERLDSLLIAANRADYEMDGRKTRPYGSEPRKRRS